MQLDTHTHTLTLLFTQFEPYESGIVDPMMDPAFLNGSAGFSGPGERLGMLHCFTVKCTAE